MDAVVIVDPLQYQRGDCVRRISGRVGEGRLAAFV
jgi:hypothetical protein